MSESSNARQGFTTKFERSDPRCPGKSGSSNAHQGFTTNFLRSIQTLGHFPVRIIQCPPGLYDLIVRPRFAGSVVGLNHPMPARALRLREFRTIAGIVRLHKSESSNARQGFTTVVHLGVEISVIRV